MKRLLYLRFFTIVFVSLFLLGFSVKALQHLKYSRFQKERYLTPRQIAFVRPGLQLEITDVAVNGQTVSVTFTIADDRGLPLDRAGVTTPGTVTTNFVLAEIRPGDTKYTALTTRHVRSPITNVETDQPAADQNGTYEALGPGTYRYTFNTKLPAGNDPAATHTVGVYATRDLAEFELGPHFANEVVNFTPGGTPVQAVRDVVGNAACRQCHDPRIPDAAVEAHGGARQKMELCVMCHTPQLSDPDTNQNLDMVVMTHKIHRGEELPSVQAGTPYVIIGFQQMQFDFSHVVFPQDVRHCDTCHQEGPTQSEAFLLRPSIAACGSCHDDVNFTTGEGHPAGPAADGTCQNCHLPFGEHEFDASILGAHTVASESEQLEGINLEVLEVTNAAPGQKPTVLFSLKDNAGAAIDPASLNFFNIVMAIPTTDYTTVISESAIQGSVASGANYTYTFAQALPADATGTAGVSAEAYRNVQIDAGEPQPTQVRETAYNPVKYVAITGEVQPRRLVVSNENCNQCHRELEAHGMIRHNVEYCAFCHNPVSTDAVVRPEDQLPAQGIDLKYLIHHIHRGEEQTRDFTVYGFGSRPINFNEVLFSGDLRLCTDCHVDQTYQVPAKGVVPTVAPRDFYNPLGPNAAACLSCHDNLDAAAHAFLNTAPFGEACATCHGPQGEFSVDRLHAR